MSKRRSQRHACTSPAASPKATSHASAAAAAPSKRQLVCTLLARENGATIDELVTATGWLPHSTRAALTCLRKKGHQIKREKVDGITRYSTNQAAD